MSFFSSNSIIPRAVLVSPYLDSCSFSLTYEMNRKNFSVLKLNKSGKSTGHKRHITQLDKLSTSESLPCYSFTSLERMFKNIVILMFESDKTEFVFLINLTEDKIQHGLCIQHIT
jgi:hypothetical protein